MTQRSLLLVEGVDAVAELIETTLRGSGIRIVLAKEYADAIKNLDAMRFDVVLADVHLHEAGYLDFEQRCRSAGAVCIFMSGHPQAMDTLDALGLPFLAKPFRVDALVELIDACIAAADPLRRGDDDPAVDA